MSVIIITLYMPAPENRKAYEPCKSKLRLYAAYIKGINPSFTIFLRKTTSILATMMFPVSATATSISQVIQQDLSEPEFYGDLVYKFRKIYACYDFSTQFRKVILRYKKIGYNINVIRQTACMVVNPITVNNFASLFNCTTAGRPQIL